MKTWTLTPNDIPGLLEGLAIRGNGGGGSPAWGKKILENDLAHGRTWRIVDPADVPDDWMAVSGGILASVKALEKVTFDEVLAGWETRFPTVEVIQLTERWIGKKINVFVPFEPGGLNSPLVLTVSSRSEYVAIDGDGVGRACPESQMTSWIGHGISLTPMPLIDKAGNAVIVIDAVEPTFSDELGRWVVSQPLGGGMGANTLYPMTGQQLKETIIPGTFSRSLEVGRAVLEARAEGVDPVATVAQVLSAKQVISGNITSVQEEERLGFFFTIVSIDGAGASAGHRTRLVIKNEAMLCFLDDRPRAMFPDCIYMLESSTGRGYMSVELRVGMPITVLTSPGHPRMRAAIANVVGERSLGPARYGHPELSYRPVEDLEAEFSVA